MAHITLTGVLLDPTGEFSVGDKVKFTHQSTTGSTIKSAVSVITVPPNGAYSINLEYGLVLVEYNDYRLGQYRNLGIATVNATNTATSIPELLNALVPVSSTELIEFQAILADAVTAKNAAETAETNAANSASTITPTTGPSDTTAASLLRAQDAYASNSINFHAGNSVNPLTFGIGSHNTSREFTLSESAGGVYHEAGSGIANVLFVGNRDTAARAVSLNLRAGGNTVTNARIRHYDATTEQVFYDEELFHTGNTDSIKENLGLDLTTTELIASTFNYPSDAVVNTTGFTTSGDAGDAPWKKNGVTGQTANQSPAQLGDGLLNDGNGDQWALIVDGWLNIAKLGAVSGQNILSILQAASKNLSVLIPKGTFYVEDPGLFTPDGLNIIGLGRGVSILKKPPGTGVLDAIIRENVISGTFQQAKNVRIGFLSLEGNGDSSLPSAKGAGLIRFYANDSLTITDCDLYKSKGYGIGLQGAEASPNVDRRGPHKNITLQNCNIYNNGKSEYLSGTDFDDGLDCKGTLDITIDNCKAWGNGDKGFDIRSRLAKITNCTSFNNAGPGFTSGIEGVQSGTVTIDDSEAIFTSCYSYDNGADGYAVVPQVTPGVVGARQTVTFDSCYAKNNSNNFTITSKGSNDLSLLELTISAITSLDPVAGTRHIIGSGPDESITVCGGLIKGGTTTAISPNSLSQGTLSVSGVTIKDITGNAIASSADPLAITNITSNVFDTVSGVVSAGNSNITISANSYRDIGASQYYSFTGSNNKVLDKALGLRSISSAATITLQETTDYFFLTGTTSVNSINPSWAGRVVSIRVNSTITVTKGGTLKIQSQFDGTPDSVLSLICDGTNWYEVSRSIV